MKTFATQIGFSIPTDGGAADTEVQVQVCGILERVCDS